MTTSRRIGIIGIGNMGTTLIAALLTSGCVGREEICASDVSVQRCYHVSKTYGVRCLSSNKDVTANSDILIIAVEPSHVKEVLEDIREVLTNQLLVSIAAGITLEFLQRNLQKATPILRAMPNNPCLVGEGMIVLTSTSEVSEEQLKVAEEIFSSLGKVIILGEHFFDAVTGLSGSGPAYIYLVIEGLVDGGVKSGLSEDVALTLAAQTVLGAGKMVLKTRTHPSKLRERVATPGGTTVEGLKELYRGGAQALFCRAVRSATKRSQEIAKT